METLSTFLSQSYPPKPPFTGADLGDLTEKVFIITGGYSGIGYQLAKLVYQSNATVYVAGPREENAARAIKDLKSTIQGSNGRLEYLPLDLANLPSIKTSVKQFLEKEKRLDVLWNNAGFMGKSSTTEQGHELHLAINCLGPFLFTKLLHPILASTARYSPEGSVRVVWLSSLVVHLQAPRGGMDLDNLDYGKKNESDAAKYAISKAGTLFIGSRWARQDAKDGVIHLTVNPGNVKTPLQRNMGKIERSVVNIMLHNPIFGAYTELFAGLSPAVKPTDSGRYIVPWGQFGRIRADIETELTIGTGTEASKSELFFEYCKRAVTPFE